MTTGIAVHGTLYAVNFSIDVIAALQTALRDQPPCDPPPPSAPTHV